MQDITKRKKVGWGAIYVVATGKRGSFRWEVGSRNCACAADACSGSVHWKYALDAVVHMQVRRCCSMLQNKE